MSVIKIIRYQTIVFVFGSRNMEFPTYLLRLFSLIYFVFFVLFVIPNFVIMYAMERENCYKRKFFFSIYDVLSASESV